MDNGKLKELVLKELQKEVPQEIARDEKKAKEFILSNINESLVNKLVAEFCEKNPDDFAVLNTFDFNNVHENAAETPENIKYKLSVNRAGLEYKKKAIDDALKELNTSVNGDNKV
jgi:hypothetical protein